MLMFTDNNLNAMVNVARVIPQYKADPKKVAEVVAYVNHMRFCKAKAYLEAVLISWVVLNRPHTAYQLCLALAYELAQTIKLTEADQVNLEHLEKLIQLQQ